MTVPSSSEVPSRLRCAIVLNVEEHACRVITEGSVFSARFAPLFPSPRLERVSPGHLVAVATAPDGADVVVWRWYDAVILGEEGDDSVRLWEPAHGEVVARRRRSNQHYEPGARAYLSAGLPGADWWVAGAVTSRAQGADVELDEVERPFTEKELWAASFGPSDARTLWRSPFDGRGGGARHGRRGR
jgi:hypothetical protein